MKEQPNLYIGEPYEWLGKTEIAERAAAQAMYTLTLSSTAFQPLRQLFEQCFRLYTNQKLNLRTQRGSQVPTGQASEIVDTYLAEYIIKLFKTRPLCGVLPRGPEDIDGARALETLLQYNHDYMHAIRVWYEILKSTCIYGTGIAKTRWIERVVSVPLQYPTGATDVVEKVAYRGPWIDPMFVFDFYPDPRASDIDDQYAKCTVSFNGWDHFERNAKAGIYLKDQVAKIREFKDLPDGVRTAVGDRVYQSEQRAELGFTNDSRQDPDGILTIEWEGWFRPTLKDDPVPSIITVANGVAVRAEPTPFVTRENGLVLTKMDWAPGQLYGTGLIQKNMPQIHAANVMLNIALTHAADTVKGLRAVKPDALYFPQELDNPPGGNLLIKKGFTIADVVADLRKGNLGNDVYNLYGTMVDRAEAVSAARDMKMGRVPKGEQTATQSTLIFQQIAQRFQLPLMMIEETGIVRATRKMHYLNRQFLDPETLYRILDQDAAAFPVVRPEDLALDPDFVCLASQRESNTDLVVAQLNNAIRNLVPLAQLDMKYLQLIDMFLLRIYEEQRFRDVSQIKRIMAAPPMPMPEPGGGGQGGPAGQTAPGRRDNRQPNPMNLQQLVKSAGGRLSNMAGMR